MMIEQDHEFFSVASSAEKVLLFYLIDAKGRVAYKAKPGPFGFKSEELRAALGRLVN